MKLSLQTDYALRTLMFLASRDSTPDSERVNVGEVAGFFGISQTHVAKVANRLARLGLIRSIRGLGGGIELARAPDSVSVGEVVEAFEGEMHLLDCVNSKEELCVIQSFCKLKDVLSHAEQLQMNYLHSVTIADVLPTNRQIASIQP